MVKELWRQIRHYQATSVAIIICIAALLWLYGCNSTVESMNTPGKMVTRPELKLEVDNYLATANLKFEDLNRQDAFKAELVKYGLVVAEGGTLNPVGVGMSLASILGLASIVDNRKKDGIITGLKKVNGTTV